LDWLATEFIAKKWSLKAMHRLILTSNTYQQASAPNPAAYKKDPTNDLLWKFDMRRLTAEEIRDSLLMVSGNLNRKQFGPSVKPEIPKEVLQGQSIPGYGWQLSPEDEQNRRSVYVHIKRSLILPIFASFDQAETDRTAPLRFASTQPTQALTFLNSAFLQKQAGILATRVQKEAGSDSAAFVKRVLKLTTQRPVVEKEIQRGVMLLQGLQKDGIRENDARKTFCLVCLNLNEFVYLD
jgi:hypothetical protein